MSVEVNSNVAPAAMTLLMSTRADKRRISRDIASTHQLMILGAVVLPDFAVNALFHFFPFQVKRIEKRIKRPRFNARRAATMEADF